MLTVEDSCLGFKACNRGVRVWGLGFGDFGGSGFRLKGFEFWGLGCIGFRLPRNNSYGGGGGGWGYCRERIIENQIIENQMGQNMEHEMNV